MGELYVTGLSMYEGKLFAVSKNFNCIFEIDPKDEMIDRAFALLSLLTMFAALSRIKTALRFSIGTYWLP